MATVALDSAGARNAAWLAAQILALNNPSLAEKLARQRQRMREEIEQVGEAMLEAKA